MWVQTNGIAATTALASVPSQKRLAPDMKSMPQMVATRTSDVPRSGCSITRIHGGTRMTRAPMIVQGDLIVRLATGEKGREDDDHDDLGQLAELELEAADDDPARGRAGLAGAGPDAERQDQQAKVDEVERPGERTEPLVVEDGGQSRGPRPR